MTVVDLARNEKLSRVWSKYLWTMPLSLPSSHNIIKKIPTQFTMIARLVMRRLLLLTLLSHPAVRVLAHPGPLQPWKMLAREYTGYRWECIYAEHTDAKGNQPAPYKYRIAVSLIPNLLRAPLTRFD